MSNRPPWLLVFAVLGCSKPTSHSTNTIDAGAFDKSTLVSALGNCALDTYRAFDVAAKKLAAEPTRETWNAAMDAWQEAEVMQWGPLGGTALPGGQGLRDQFYAWPLIGRCQIDRAIANKTYESADFAKTSLVTTRGLAALEYLLFYAGTDNGCGSSEDINASGTWAALSKEELAARKAAYAKVLANDLTAHSGELVTVWTSSFLQSFSSAGKGSVLFPTHEKAFDSVVDAMFYVDEITKDRKISIPIGLVDPAACAEPPCADLLESKYAVRAKQHVRANLVALRKLLIGCGKDFSGVGFDDLFDAVGASGNSDELDEDLVLAIAAVDAFPYPSFEDAMAKGDTAALDKLRVAIKDVTDNLKTDFKSILKLNLPMRVAGDMD
jgi:uncharacterized protein